MTRLPGSTFASRNAARLTVLASGMTPRRARPIRPSLTSTAAANSTFPRAPRPPGVGPPPPMAAAASGTDEPGGPADPGQVVQALPVLIEPGTQLRVGARVVPPGRRAHAGYSTLQEYLNGDLISPGCVRALGKPSAAPGWPDRGAACSLDVRDPLRWTNGAGLHPRHMDRPDVVRSAGSEDHDQRCREHPDLRGGGPGEQPPELLRLRLCRSGRDPQQTPGAFHGQGRRLPPQDQRSADAWHAPHPGGPDSGRGVVP